MLEEASGGAVLCHLRSSPGDSEPQRFGARADRSPLSKTCAQSCGRVGGSCLEGAVCASCPCKPAHQWPKPCKGGGCWEEWRFFSCFFQIFVIPE